MDSVDSASLTAWMDANKITTPDVRAEIVSLGALDPNDLIDLEDEDIEALCAKMKKLEYKRSEGCGGPQNGRQCFVQRGSYCCRCAQCAGGQLVGRIPLARPSRGRTAERPPR